MKQPVPDLRWLPPAELWDFRQVPPAECRLACHWEYSRDLRLDSERAAAAQPVGSSRPPRLYCPPGYHQPASALFLQPWLSLTPAQRASVLASFYAVPAVQVRQLGDFLKRQQWPRDSHVAALQPFLDRCYVVQPSFTRCGIEAVIKELKSWARQEAKRYPPARRAKAAELPFDALKWLAVSRLDHARREAGLTYARAQAALLEYRRQHPVADRHAVFPTYASPGAWSKARSDADRCRHQVFSQPGFLLDGLS